MNKRVLLTGADGFVGRNLQVKLKELAFGFSVFNHHDIKSNFPDLIRESDFIFHLAGVNRPSRDIDFKIFNEDFTGELCELIKANKRPVSIVFSSSIQADLDNPYGLSKLNSENLLNELKELGCKVYIYRLPNLFGKWSRANYNSVVATFCDNTLKDKEIYVSDPDRVLKLAYIDDVLDEFISTLINDEGGFSFTKTIGYDEITLSELANIINSFKKNEVVSSVGEGLLRKLYATFLSYKEPENFSYQLTSHADSRGVFVEFLKTESSGQISFFTAGLGVTRGGHYHHTKNEKFLVVKGRARFQFVHIFTNQKYVLEVDAGLPTIVETIPGWAHEITNIGNEEMLVIIWANEIFDKNKPDTFKFGVRK